jgi:hypothetical protein
MSDYDYSHTMPSPDLVVRELRAAATGIRGFSTGGALGLPDQQRLADWLDAQASRLDDEGVTDSADGAAFRFAAGLLDGKA